MRDRFAALRQLHLRELRRNPLRTGLAVLAVASGVAMLLAIVVVVRSTTASFEGRAEALAGPAPLRVVGVTPNGGVTADDLATIETTDGVAVAAPLVRGLQPLERTVGDEVEHGDDVLLLGTTGAIGSVLGLDAEALTAGYVVTPEVAEAAAAFPALRTDVGPVPLHAGVLTVDDRLTDLGPMVAATDLATAQDQLGRGDGIDVVYVVPDAGVSVATVEARLGDVLPPGLQVLAADELPPELGQVLGQIVPVFTIMGLLALAIGAVLVANTVTLSLVERRVQLAVVSSLGATARQVVTGCLVQAALLGAVAGLLGAGLAVLAAYPLTDAVDTWTMAAAGIDVEVVPGRTPVALAVVFGALVAMVATWRPARRATRADVAAELSLRERREEIAVGGLAVRAGVALVVGVGFVALAVVGGENGSLAPWQPAAAWLGLVLSLVVLAYAAGRLGAVLAAVVLRRVRPSRPSIRLACANLVREPSRTAVMVIAAAARSRSAT